MEEELAPKDVSERNADVDAEGGAEEGDNDTFAESMVDVASVEGANVERSATLEAVAFLLDDPTACTAATFFWRISQTRSRAVDLRV